MSNKPTIPALADIRNASEYTGTFTADVLANAPAGGGGGGLTDEQAAQLAAIKTQTDTLGCLPSGSYGGQATCRVSRRVNLSRGTDRAQRSRTVGRYECFQGSTEAICRLILSLGTGSRCDKRRVTSITYSFTNYRTTIRGANGCCWPMKMSARQDGRAVSMRCGATSWHPTNNFKHVPEISENDAFATAGTNCFVDTP